MTSHDDAGLLTTLRVGDIKGDFFIPDYQRGYRWGEQEVSLLLKDIHESKGEPYYLQPLVVKQRDDDSWELVDGQQRLTTLYLIFQYLRREHLPKAKPAYSLSYETRPGSREYLEELAEHEAGSNIDFFHMHRAYRCIKSWFEGFEPHRQAHEATRFHGYLFESVHVLWYEAPKQADSRELFRRLNVGRIPLTDAELVKALLLSRSQGGPGRVDRSPEIAAYWDDFERDLRDPEVWAFVTGEAESQATHISLLLDTLAGGPRGRDRPPFYTFETLRGEIESDPQEFWRRVVSHHSLVTGWFEDRDLFHKIGYLIATGHSFSRLVELGREKGRRAFEASLDQEIRSRLKLTSDGVGELSYLNNSNKTSNVLLLMNVETIRQMTDSSERYSFKAHAAGTWSLEHIHAQNAEALNTVDQWTTWLKYHREALEDLPDLDEDRRASLLRRIDETLPGVNQQTFSALEQDLTNVFTPEGEADGADVHSIANLALLDTLDNAALNNSVFEVKRREIIARDKRGSYIPICTRNVFLKYYTDSGRQQLHFWSAEDWQAYFAAIRALIDAYLLPGVTEA